MPNDDVREEVTRRTSRRRRDRFKRTGTDMKHVRHDLVRDGERFL